MLWPSNGADAVTGATTLIAVGALFLAGIALDAIGRRAHVPRVTLLVLLGVIGGPPGLDILPAALAQTDDTVAPVALTMVAFLLGGQLKPSTLSAHGREIMALSLSVVTTSAIVVGAGLWLVTGDPVLSLLLAGISAATDPAATHDVIRSARATGRFATNLLGVVAVDDAWGIVIFSLMLLAAGSLVGGNAVEPVLQGLTELAGAVAIGVAVGLPAAYLTGRIKPGNRHCWRLWASSSSVPASRATSTCPICSPA